MKTLAMPSFQKSFERNMTPLTEQNQAPVADLKEMEPCMLDKDFQNSLLNEAQ